MEMNVLSLRELRPSVVRYSPQSSKTYDNSCSLFVFVFSMLFYCSDFVFAFVVVSR